MHFFVDSKDIKRACILANQTVDNHNYNPVVTNFKLVVDTKLTILATNLRTSAHVTVDAEVKNSGEVCVEAKRLTEFVKTLKGLIEFKLVKNILVVKAGKAACKLPTIKTDEFPNILIADENTLIPIQESFFSDGLKKASYCCSQQSDNSRYLLACVLIEVSSDTATIASTNGMRLAVYDHKIKKTDLTTDIKAPIPKEAVDFLTSCLKYNVCNTVHYFIDDTAINIKIGQDLIIKLQLMEGMFPNFRQIVDSCANPDNKVIIQTASLRNAVKQISLFTKDSSDRAINIKISDEIVTLSASDLLLGSGESGLDCETQLTQPEYTFIVQPEYITQALSAINEIEVVIAWKTESQLLIIKGTDASNVHIISTIEE